MTRGVFYIITAPSGAGKTSLVKALVENDESLCVSVSHTTRSRRPSEKDGVNYHFVSDDIFITMLTQGDFLESAEVYGNRYVTSQHCVDRQLARGIDMIMAIDLRGAAQVRKSEPKSPMS